MEKANTDSCTPKNRMGEEPKINKRLNYNMATSRTSFFIHLYRMILYQSKPGGIKIYKHPQRSHKIHQQHDLSN